MFKKFALILLILSYSISIFGMSVKKFYCCGKLKSISVLFQNTGQKENTKNSATFGNNCCKTTYQNFQVKDNHFASADVNLPAKYFTPITTVFNLFSSSTFTLQKVNCTYQSHAPPLFRHIPIYLSNRVFRI